MSLFISCISYAQSNLPPCNGNFSGPCFGSQELTGGEIYVGQFKDGKANGQGTYIYADGEKYLGQFKDGKANGQGTNTWTNGDKYVGQFINDNRTGQGTYTFANGNKYVGQFKDNKYDGFGTLYNSDGSIRQQGIWKDDQFVQAQTPPVKEVKPKPTVNNSQDIKRQKCIRLGLVPGSVDFQQCMN